MFRKEDFTVLLGVTTPETTFSTVIHFIYLSSVLLPILMNYIAFYMIVKDSYTSEESRYISKGTLAITNEEINQIESLDIKRRDTNKDLDSYFKM